MQHFLSLESVQCDRAWLTVGVFDGVHLGHQAILRRMAAEAHADGAPAVALTFDPHPAIVLGKREGSYLLTMPEERAQLIGALGIDILITHPFDNQVAAVSAPEFVSRLKAHLGFRQLWVGYDFALGRGREGDVAMLRLLGQQMGFSVQVVESVQLEGGVVSSSRIRASIQEGDVSTAARLLGRPYRLGGRVVAGEGRGRTLGIPTINLSIPPGKMIPAAGVYACQVLLAGRRYAAATNIGVRPTFNQPNGQSRLETHILDFSQDLYGQVVEIEFIQRLRGEQRFPDSQALLDQVHQDIQTVRQLLG